MNSYKIIELEPVVSEFVLGVHLREKVKLISNFICIFSVGNGDS